jgi:hypothetical protein
LNFQNPGREYLKDKINELETNRKNESIRDLRRSVKMAEYVNPGSACCITVQNLLFSRQVSKKVKIVLYRTTEL